MWLNADILRGPGGDMTIQPVDAHKFLEQVQKMHNVVLAIGWTTSWMPNSEKSYKKENTNAMLEALKENMILDYKDLAFNFHVHAGYAIRSKEVLKDFYEEVKKTNPITYTVWADSKRGINAKELNKFIHSFGVENVYIDLPQDIRNHIDFDLSKNRLAEDDKPKDNDKDKPKGNGASSIVQFGLFNLIPFLIVTIFRH